MSGPREELDASVQAMLAGDQDAFRRVYRAVHPPLLRYLSVLVGSAEAEDVASETWAQAFADLDRFSGDADGFRGWVTTIGRHRAMDHLRRSKRRPRAHAGVEELVDLAGPVDVEASALGLLGTEAALALVGSLPPDQAEAVMLRAVVGLDARTAGEVLGKRPGAVRAAAYRGLKSLARRLQEAEPRDPRPGRNTSGPSDAERVR